ncbi:hypothetical protein ATO00_06565 [Loigolactobacillus coryniformis subsp. coryniformis]|nr:GntR family transcriptional regulator [Loigolactobacillus coryniformis]OEH90124.1 hypothetical protein ATO00_06565 [Loigolactobacillus coryniformis subsp. coryniformis]
MEDGHGEYLRLVLLGYKNEVASNSLTQQAYLVILKAIRNLYLEPGKSFLEREITDLLEMSRTPVHEALIRLEMEGWLKVIPRKGFKVEPILRRIIIEISEITEVLDGLAVELATNIISNEELDRLDRLIDKQEEAMYNKNLKTYVAVDQEFHNLIVDQSRNNRLIKAMANYSDQLYRARLYTINARKLPIQSIQEHRAIVAAIRAKNKIAARELMQGHRHRGSLEIADIIKKKS